MIKPIFYKIFRSYILFILYLLIFFYFFSVKNLFHIILIGILLSFLLSFFISRDLSKPLEDIASAFKKMSNLNFNSKVFLDNNHPIKDIADNFNYASNELQNIFIQLQDENKQIKSIISSIQEAVLILDDKGRIKFGNESFKRIVNNNLISGKPHWDVLRGTDFYKLLNRIKNEKNSFVDEIELFGKTFMCSVSLSNFNNQIIVIFHDITQLKNFQNIQKDLVASVSHELKTPLTSIKGFIETLKDEVDGENKHYIDIIERNTNRLVNIVDDLLLLSKLEDEKYTLEISEIKIDEFLQRLVKIFENRLKEKKLELILNITDSSIKIFADEFKLEQVFINLIDNAIKYTEKGRILISIKKLNEKIIIEIEDTGIGISQEHLSRIFDKFYVVDKSRSRKLGGTGLGLSIVANIISLHNGSIDVKSTPNVGTKFTIILPTTIS